MTNQSLALLLMFGGSLSLSLVFTSALRKLATRAGLVDKPDGTRKMHEKPTPVAGGIGILLACLVTLASAFLLSDYVRQLFQDHRDQILGLLTSTVLVCMLGVVDDYGLLRGRYKLLGQLAVVLVIVAVGVRVDRVSLFGSPTIELGWFGGLLFTVFWLLGAINSLNLLDGMDGLLGTIGLIIALAFAVLAGVNDQWLAACVAVVLAGGILGFLRYNFPPASIFLGDSGSMLIGLTIGVLAIQSSLKGPATISLATPLAILTVPILDTLAAIIRRKLTGRSIYTTDRGHMHHCMLNRGLSNYAVLACVASLCLLTVVGALASLALKNELLAVLSALTVVWILIVTRLFGYVEFVLVKKRLTITALRMFPGRAEENAPAHELEVQLQGSAGWRELWLRLTSSATEMKLKSVTLDLNVPALHEGYHARWDRRDTDVEPAAVWRVEIPLELRGKIVGRLEMAGRRDADVFWKIAKMATILEDFEIAVASLADSDRTLPVTNGAAGAAAALAGSVK